MPIEGVSVEVADGEARIEFVDKSIKGAVIGELAELAGRHGIRLDSGGTRRTYIVAESVAVAAGLVDPAEPEDAPEPEIRIPTRNGSKAQWEAWLDHNVMEYPETASRDDLIAIWDAAQEPPKE